MCLEPLLYSELICAAPAATKEMQNHVLTYTNICSIMQLGESQNSQLSGEVHTLVGPQTFMGLVGHCKPP